MPNDEWWQDTAEPDGGSPHVGRGVGGGTRGGTGWNPAGGVAASDDPPRREIGIGADLPRIVAEAGEALATLGRVYRRGGRLVDVVAGVDGPSIRTLTACALRLRLAEAADWYRMGADAEGKVKRIAVQPPTDVSAVVAEAGEWPVAELIGIAAGPLIRGDGSLATSDGYDPKTRWYSSADPAEWTPTALGREEAAIALDELRALTVDYPCASDSDRSAMIAGILTAVGRTAITGPVPLHLLHATTAGSGKSLWVDVIARIASGAPAARMPPSTGEEEERKRITSILMSGAPIVLIDNVAGTLGGASLDALLTSRLWTDRVLGSSEMVRLPVTCTFFATGNNVTVRGDLARRTIPARLEPSDERPETRAGLPDIERIATADRPRLLRAALTVILSYLQAERVTCRTFGSYDDWSRIAREPLIWLGAADPLDSQDALRDVADVTADTTLGLLSAVFAEHGRMAWTVRDLTMVAREHPIRLALEEAGLVRGPAVDARAIGYWLRRTRGRRLGGLVLQPSGSQHGNVRSWVIRHVDTAGANVVAGSVEGGA